MSTCIEILDYEQTENIISPLVFDFDQIVYLYDEHHDYQNKRTTLKELLNKKGITNIEFIEVNGHNDAVFEDLSRRYPDAMFNLSNGSRTLLVQMARFCERTKQKCYTLNFQRKSFHDIYGCDVLKTEFKVPHLKIEDVICLSAGEILKTSHALPELNDEMKQDMNLIIQLMNRDSSSWTRLLSSFAKAIRENEDYDCSIWLDEPQDKGQKKLLEGLQKMNVIQVFEHGNRLHLVFKNRTLMNMLKDSGAWLEYQSYLECLNSGLFDDVRISTVVDWNKQSKNHNDPTCEIDLIVIKNCIPVFVSCKMNKCTALDLYEIKLLAQKLGGTLGKAAVISKAPSLKDNEPLYLKAKELGILLIREKEIESGLIASSLLELI